MTRCSSTPVSTETEVKDEPAFSLEREPPNNRIQLTALRAAADSGVAAGADARFLASAISRRDSLPAGLWRAYTLRHHAVLQAPFQPGTTAIHHHQHLSARAPFPLRAFCRCFVRALERLRLPPTVHDQSHYRVWQRRFYPFNVYSEKKRLEKLNYMHHNPVKRGLVSSPGDWPWSSWRFYFLQDASIFAMDRLG